MIKMEDTSQSVPLWKPSLIAGLGLLVMIVLAVFAIGVMESVLSEGNAPKTAQNILASGSRFSLGMWGLLVIAALDVLIGVALLKFFVSVTKSLAWIAAGSRISYAVIFAIAIFQLVEAIRDPNRGLAAINSFNDIWHVSLLIFGVHLLLVGILVWRAAFKSGYATKATGVILGGLLVIGGAGYLIDNVGLVLISGYETNVIVVAAEAVGESLLMVWLLFKSYRLWIQKHRLAAASNN